tara:strand:+ start:10499 stop:11518 length:1020 start_codon:yes stop_codon:yes gene_type:complete
MKHIAIVDPYPRTMDLIFSKSKLNDLKKTYSLIFAPKKNKNNFYKNNIHKARFIIGQPNLPKSLLIKAKKLKAVINVESNFVDNMDYNYCFNNGIHVIATSPVFAKPVAEIALGFTLSLLRNIHGANQDFMNKKEKYGLDGNLKSSLLSNKVIGLMGYGDLGKALAPLLVPFSKKINVYDPWIPNKEIIKQGFKPISLKQLFSKCEVIYVLAAITTENKAIINKNLLNLIKSKSLFILMSRAAVVNFDDLKKRLKKGDIYAAIDVFPEEPVKKNDPIRKLKNVLFSAHRAGALDQAFKEMGDIVFEDMKLISKNDAPRFCKKAQKKTVHLLRSKPVAIN